MFDLISEPRQYGALILTEVSSTVIFFRRVLLLNKFTWPPTRSQIAVYGISLLSGCLFWMSLNAVNEPIWLQVTSGGYSTLLAWLVYVVLVNERLMFPTMQQWISLAFYVVTEVCLLFQVRLVLSDI